MDNIPSKSREISLKELFSIIKRWFIYLFSKSIIIILFVVLGLALGFAYAYFRKPNYKATTSFVIEESGSGLSGALGQYAGLASMAGIDIGGGGNNLFQGDNILELYKSRRMLKKTLLSKLKVGTDSQLIVDRYISFNDLREKWSREKGLENIDFNIKQENFTVKHDSLINIILKTITSNSLRVVKQDKKLSIINVSFESKDEIFAKAFVERLVENVNEFYRITKTKKSTENVAKLQKQTDSVRRALNAAITGVALSDDFNPNPNAARQILRVPGQRKTVDVQASSAVLEELIKHLEISKLTLRNDEPLIQLIDTPVLPLQNDKIGFLKGMVLGGFILGFLAVIFLTFKYLIDD